MSLHNFDGNNQQKTESKSGKKENADIEDVFQIRKELRVERQRVRAEQQISKE